MMNNFIIFKVQISKLNTLVKIKILWSLKMYEKISSVHGLSILAVIHTRLLQTFAPVR